jgi:hypothetical protein
MNFLLEQYNHNLGELQVPNGYCFDGDGYYKGAYGKLQSLYTALFPIKDHINGIMIYGSAVKPKEIITTVRKKYFLFGPKITIRKEIDNNSGSCKMIDIIVFSTIEQPNIEIQFYISEWRLFSGFKIKFITPSDFSDKISNDEAFAKDLFNNGVMIYKNEDLWSLGDIGSALMKPYWYVDCYGELNCKVTQK